jgi:hypothetical protein
MRASPGGGELLMPHVTLSEDLRQMIIKSFLYEFDFVK